MERRLLVRKLLDEHDAQDRLSRRARSACRPRGNYRVDQHFTAGWIALRFLHDPKTRRRAFRPYRRRHRQPARAGARRLLAGPRRRSHGPAGTGQDVLRGRGTTHRHLLRPAGARAARLAAISACAARRAFRRRSRATSAISKSCARRKSSTRSTSAICSPRSIAELGESATDVAGMAMLAELAGQAWRRPRHGAARRGRLWTRPAARLLRLSDRRPA